MISDQSTAQEEIEGIESEGMSWGDYPIDDLLIRNESRTIHDIFRRIDKEDYIMNPEFQRDFIWDAEKQSKLIESVIMRIPLPVFYLAENQDGKMVVVDGVQRLSTFHRFIKGELKLKLPKRKNLDGLRFSELPPRFQNRIEDCNLTIYSIDSKVPERARLDIFERVNSGVPLTRQQMRNCLFSGVSTKFLKDESATEIFLKATGKSLNSRSMRDREFVNRFCAFQLLGVDDYRGDMDEFLAQCLRQMNRMDKDCLPDLSKKFRRSLENNLLLFKDHAFRRSIIGQEKRSGLNASFWDVMSTGLTRYERETIERKREELRDTIFDLLKDKDFVEAITYGPNDAKKVRQRFKMCWNALGEVLNDNMR